ncbi:MAG: hypothetical protein IJX23_04700 [Clostridia bacterium]|nr:hypothetical protein [Clostridia bacterium]
MKKLLVFILIATVCLLPMVFSACGIDVSVISAEEMLPHCNDSLTTNPLDGAKNINIQADLYSVAVHNVSGDKVTIDFTQHEKSNVTTSIKYGTLYIVQQWEPLIATAVRNLYVVVGLPESWQGYTFSADLDVGALSIEQINADVIDVEMDTGACMVTTQTASVVNLESDTGAIIFQGKAGILTVDVDTGAVKLDGQADKVIANTDTGAIKVDMLATELDLSSNTGSIVFTVGNNKTIKVQSDTGSVRGTIDGVQSHYSILVDVDTGSCNLKDQIGTGTNILEIDVDTGSVNVTFKQ